MSGSPPCLASGHIIHVLQLTTANATASATFITIIALETSPEKKYSEGGEEERWIHRNVFLYIIIILQFNKPR